MKNWDNFHKVTANKPARKNIVHFMSKYKILGNAIDLGCGAGNDTIFLIQKGLNVLAIDSSNVEELIRKRLSDKQQEKLKFEVQKFESLKLPKCDLLISNYSLPFCEKNYFHKMWEEICLSIKTNGYFVGNFFGLNDEWNTNQDKRTFLSKQQILKLFTDFEILEIKETEKDEPTAEGQLKHWHIIEVVAQKHI